MCNLTQDSCTACENYRSGIDNVHSNIKKSDAEIRAESDEAIILTLRAQLKETHDELERYKYALAHYHVDGKGEHPDVCDQCGLDIREDVHAEKYRNRPVGNENQFWMDRLPGARG